MANQVIVTLSARDLISPQLAQIRANIESVGARARASLNSRDLAGLSADQLRQLRENMRLLDPPEPSQGFLGAALFGNLGSDAIAQGIQLVTSGVQRLSGAIQEAASLETQSLAQSGDLSTKLGISFAKSQELVAQTRMDIAKIAAELPGDNANYKAIYSQISASVAGNARGDVEKYRQDSIELTKRFGILFAIRGADANMGGLALNQAISGTRGLGELRQIDGFQRNPLLLENLTKELKAIGKSEGDWRSLTNDQRMQLLLKAAQKSITDETIKSFEGSMQSMVELVNFRLFDQDAGLFGVLRKLKSQGNRSVFDATKASMSAVLNLFAALGRVGESLGLSFDPLDGVITLLDWFSDVTNAITGVLNGGDIGNITTLFLDLWGGVIELTNRGLSALGRVLEAVPWGDVGEQFAYLLSRSLGEFLRNINWLEIAKTIGRALVASMEFLDGAIKGLFYGLDDALGQFLNKQTTNLLRSSLGGLPVPEVDISGALKTAGEFGSTGIKSILSPATGVIDAIKPLVTPSTPKSDDKQSFAPQVNIQATTSDPQSIASAVMTAIDDLYSNYMENQLA